MVGTHCATIAEKAYTVFGIFGVSGPYQNGIKSLSVLEQKWDILMKN
jgi:hypothetical protein